jgi:hypothetical protein
MKALGVLIQTSSLGTSLRSTRNYRTGNQTHISREEHYDSDRRTAVPLPERTFSKAFVYIVGPTQYIQQTKRYLSPGAKRPGFKLNTDLSQLSSREWYLAHLQRYRLRLTELGSLGRCGNTVLNYNHSYSPKYAHNRILCYKNT